MSSPAAAHLHTVTPLASSPTVAHSLGVKAVYLKLDALQPGGSFKIRGIGHQISKQVQKNANLKMIVSSSGGNAGVAATLAGIAHNLSVRVHVPISTPQLMIDCLRAAGADVVVHGAVWDEAHAEAEKFAATQGPSALLVHPFEGEDLWEGHSTIIDEIAMQLPESVVPDVVICAVGGGGLLCGVLEGLKRVYGNVEKKPVVVAVETEGAQSFSLALEMGRPVPLPGGITSIARSLGALQVSNRPLQLREEYGRERVRSHVVTDAQAVGGLVAFADELGILVEPSCGAGLALAYGGELKKAVPELGSDSTVVVIVCGGSIVNLDLIRTWRDMFGV